MDGTLRGTTSIDFVSRLKTVRTSESSRKERASALQAEGFRQQRSWLRQTRRFQVDRQTVVEGFWQRREKSEPSRRERGRRISVACVFSFTCHVSTPSLGGQCTPEVPPLFKTADYHRLRPTAPCHPLSLTCPSIRVLQILSIPFLYFRVFTSLLPPCVPTPSVSPPPLRCFQSTIPQATRSLVSRAIKVCASGTAIESREAALAH